LKLTAEPRTTFQYCNLMFVVASHVVETLTGMWLGDFLKERIWEPLGMKSTVSSPFSRQTKYLLTPCKYFSTEAAQAAPEPLAQGYVYYDEEFKEVPYMDLSIISGAGSIVSNVLDYAKWIRDFHSQSGPISKAGYKSLLTSRSILSDEESSGPYTGPQAYTLGWFTGTYQGYEFFSHSGGMEAFGAQVIFFPTLDYGIVSFGNTASTSNAVELRLLWQLVDDKIRVPEEKRFDWNKQ